MRMLNLEVLDRKVVRLQERPSGDVELVVSNLRKDMVDRHVKYTGGVHDEVIAVIPKHRKDLIAAFFTA